MTSILTTPAAPDNGNIGIYFQVSASRDVHVTKLAGLCWRRPADTVALIVCMYHHVGGLGEPPGTSGWNLVLQKSVSPDEHSLPVHLLLQKGMNTILVVSSAGVGYASTLSPIGSVLIQDDVLTIHTGYGSSKSEPTTNGIPLGEGLGRNFVGAIEYESHPQGYNHMDKLTTAMQADIDFADVEIICGSQRFAAHRLVLAATSPVFAAMLKADMAEARCGKIVIEDVRSGAVAAALQFMYKGTVPDDVDDEAVHFAHKYDINGMVSEVGKAILRKLTPDCIPSIVRSLRPYKRSREGDDEDSEASLLHARVRQAVLKDPALMESCLDHL